MIHLRSLGIMQGRLLPPVDGLIQSFPRERWEEEFTLAAAAGLGAIEWIYDTYGLGANPLETEQGVARIGSLTRLCGVAVHSICADYFMDFSFARGGDAERSERVARLGWLLGQANRLGVTRIVLPFVDQSAIRDVADREAAVDSLGRALPAAEAAGIELHLETSLAPDDFAMLLAFLPHPLVRVNYDSGNSSALGYKPAEEFAAYGDRVGSVHVKDRVRNGATVPLGEGDADLDSMFACLKNLSYAGDIVLQVARGIVGDELQWARHNRAFVEGKIH